MEPLLWQEPPHEFDILTARDVMASPCLCLTEVPLVSEDVGRLLEDHTNRNQTNRNRSNRILTIEFSGKGRVMTII